MLQKNVIFFILIARATWGNDEVLLESYGRPAEVRFKTSGTCGLVYPYGSNLEQERELTKHYLYHSSRLKLNDASPGFSIENPTYQEALLWSCCTVAQKSETTCRAELNRRKAVSTFSPVRVSRIIQVYHENDDKELSAILVEANLPRPTHEHGEVQQEQDVQIVVDVDPSSCDGKRYTKRFTYKLLSKSRRDRNWLKVFTFSDSLLPKDCNVFIYLQKSCQFNTDECKVVVSGIPSYSHSENDQFKSQNFTTSYRKADPNQILIGSDRQIDGKSLNVFQPTDDQFPMTNDISFFINSGNITAKLPFVYPNYLTGKITGNKAVCDAKGNPKPDLYLKNSDNGELQKCIAVRSCGWNCRSCSWSLPQSTLLHGKVICVASNFMSTREIVLEPTELIGELKRLAPRTQTVSIYGELNGQGGHEFGAIHLNATVTIANWRDKWNYLVEQLDRRSMSKQRDRKRVKGPIYAFRRERREAFESVLKNQVRFTKKGTDHFACNRRRYNVFFDPKCLNPPRHDYDTCEATIQLVIFFPQTEDDGSYGVELTTQSKMIQSAQVRISTELTEFVRAINTTKEGQMQYNKFMIDECWSIDGEAAKCRWFAMWRQHKHSTIYSVTYFNSETCGDYLAPNNTLITNYINENTKAPKPLSLVTRDLQPGVKYNILVCTWQKGAESDEIIVEGRPQGVVTGYGPRYCRFYETINKDGVKINYLQQPPEPPRDYPRQPSVRKGLGFVEFSYSNEEFNKVAQRDVEGFDVIFRQQNDPYQAEKFTECGSCPRLRFIASSQGKNSVRIGNVLAGTQLRATFRWRNSRGVGPYDDTMIPNNSGRYVDVDVYDGLRHGNIQILNVARQVGSDATYVVFDVHADSADDLPLVLQKDDDIYPIRTSEKCFKLEKSNNVHCKVPIADNVERLVIASESQIPITTILFNQNEVVDSIQEPQLTYANRTKTDVTVRFIPKVVLFHPSKKQITDQIATATYTVFIKYTDQRNHQIYREDPKRNFVEHIVLPTADTSGSEIEFVYKFRNCQLVYKNRAITRQLEGCPEFSDVQIWVGQSFILDEREIESLPSLSLLLEPSQVHYQSPTEVQKQIAEFPIPKMEVTPLLYESRRVFVDFYNIHVAMWNEFEVQVQFVPKPYDYECNEPQAFHLFENGGNAPKALDEHHNMFTYLTTKWSIPRQRYDAFSHSTSEKYFDIGKIRTYSQLPDRIRWLGGLDGYKDHCGASVTQCLIAIDSLRPSNENRLYMPNGFISLPDNPSDTIAHKRCYYCYRSRVIFKGDDSFGDCGEDGCNGAWSEGGEFKNPEDRGCDWKPQFPGYESYRTTPVPITPISPKDTEPTVSEQIIHDTSMNVLEIFSLVGGVLLVIVLVIIVAAVICGTKYCRRRKENMSAYGRYHETPGLLENTSINRNLCNPPQHRHQESMEYPGHEEPNKPRSYSPHTMPNQTDESVCSFVSRPGSSRYSSFDSGIDRNSGSFRSDTPWTNN